MMATEIETEIVARGEILGVPVTATWRGGPYVNVSFAGLPPADVINVWDDAAGRRQCPYTPEALAAVLAEYLTDPERDWEHDLPHYMA